ncbi:MAG: ABC-2 family transporter protein [Lentisphaerae bacterium]|nr:ABC-2 family transporter protein [Lentisphaerota bacterium]
MWRYLTLYGYCLRFSFSRAMEFRVDFCFRIVMDVFFYFIDIVFFRIIYLHTTTLGGWDENQAMVFVGCFLLLDALDMTVLANNLYQLPQSINRGDLDYHLIRPVSPLFMLSLRDFAANSFVNLLMAFGILGYFLSRYTGPITPGGLILLAGSLCMGFLLRYLMRMLTIIPVFWWHRGQGLQMMFWHMTRFIERPDRIYTGAVRVLLTTVLPFALMASVPVRFFFEPFDPGLFLHVSAVLAAFIVVVAVFWRAGLRAYSSASS